MKNLGLNTKLWMAHRVLIVGGIAGIFGLFLPFAYGFSPLEALKEWELWKLAVPFFLAPFATAASFRWILSGSFSRIERAMAFILSSGAAAVTLRQYFVTDNWSSSFEDWLLWFIPLVTYSIGVFLLIRNSRIAKAREFNPVMALQTVYLANALMCLVGFFGKWETGAYCVLMASILYTIQITLVSRQGTQPEKNE